MEPNHVHSATCGCKDVRYADQGVDLLGNIDITKIKCYNESELNAGQKVFKTEDKKLEPEPFVESDVDGELLFHINFKTTVKIKQLCVIASSQDNAPVLMKLYKNQETVDFGIAESTPVQQFDMIPNLNGETMYSTNFSKFQDVSSLTIYMANEEIDDIQVQYIQLKGVITNIKKGVIVDAVYEIRPVDIKNRELDERKTGNETC